MRRLPVVIIAAVVLGMVSACSTGRTVMEDIIMVEGEVTVRGNEPFTGVWLETDERNSYILVLTAEQRASLVNPVRYRVTGAVYRGDWNGMALAHLRVIRLERAGGDGS